MPSTASDSLFAELTLRFDIPSHTEEHFADTPQTDLEAYRASDNSTFGSWPNMAVKRTLGASSVRAVRGKCVLPTGYTRSRNFVRPLNILRSRL